MNATHRLEGRVAIVTGAGGTLAEAIAARFAAEGARVVLAGPVAAGTPEPAAVERRALDPADAAQWDALVAGVERSHGALHVLVNAAAAYAPAALLQTSLAQFDAVFRGTLEATWLGMRACVPALRRTRGAIVNLSSIGGVHPGGFGAAHAVMTEGIALASRSVAVDNGPTGPRVNVVQAGRVWDPEHAPSVAPLGGTDELADVVSTVLFLASDEASMITGEVFRVDAGRALA
ncbi:MAG: SDR family NAD(P)-dependent oxidoreductase [Gammaproteobacteria bacterium]